MSAYTLSNSLDHLHGRTGEIQAAMLSRQERVGRNVAMESFIRGTSIALAAALFVDLRNGQAERTYPPEGNFIEVDSMRLH